MTIRVISMMAIKRFQDKNCELGCIFYFSGLNLLTEGYPQCCYPGSPLRVENGICLYRKEFKVEQNKEANPGTN